MDGAGTKSSAFAVGSGSLRAGVLGVNDGLVSNFSLVMGVAGGTGNPDFVLLAGIAGLLAGAFSMAAGEYVSMRSQRDVYEHRLQLKRYAIETRPEEEEQDLTLVYQSKGLPRPDAQLVARHVMADPEVALDTIARESLGLDPSQLGSPWGASISSFTAFVVGSLVPILPYVFGVEHRAALISAALSAGALLCVGGLMAWTSERSVLLGSLQDAVGGRTGSVRHLWRRSADRRLPVRVDACGAGRFAESVSQVWLRDK